MAHLKLVPKGNSSLPSEPGELKEILAKIRCIHHLGTSANWTQMVQSIEPVYDIVESNLMGGK